MRHFALAFLLIQPSTSQTPLEDTLTDFSSNLPLVHETTAFQADAISPAWKPARLYTPPAANRPLLGQFKSRDELTLEINELNEHDRILICIEIVIFCHWDGIWETYGPDTWKASIKGGSTLLETTFSNFSRAKQNFPDESGLSAFPMQTGASSIGDLDFVEEMGEHKGGWRNQDATYRIWLAASHSDPRLTLSFSGNFHDDPDNVDDWGKAGENWAVKACRVWAVPSEMIPKKESTNLAVNEILSAPGKAPTSAAFATLVLSGKHAFPHLITCMQEADLSDLVPKKKGEAKLDANRQNIIAALASEKFLEREKASKRLSTLLPQHREFLEKTAENHQDPEVSERIYQALDEFEDIENPLQNNNPSLLQLVKPRLERILRLISADQRKEWNPDHP